MQALVESPITMNTPVAAPYASNAVAASGHISAAVTDRIEDVEAVWRQLEEGGIASPGGSYDFIALWLRNRRIAPSQQRFVVGSVGGVPVALLPLHKRWLGGLQVYTWFPHSHVGSYTPVADLAALAALAPEQRRQLWRQMVSALPGADAVYLRHIPAAVGGHDGLFDELGAHVAVETLYRTQYASWEECDREQRSRTRRKHDRQQGDRLAALGTVSFEEIRNGGAGTCAIETMFQQRSARFKDMGVPDPFVRENIMSLYHDAMRPGSGVDVRLHVLRLDGAVVAVRYNVAQGDQLFCLISSMSADPAVQAGSPGKQCLLRVMQTVFDEGVRAFDMGAGYTDEKRQWCNVQVPLRHHYLGVTRRGGLAISIHAAVKRLRARAKANKRLMGWVRTAGQWSGRVRKPVAHSGGAASSD